MNLIFFVLLFTLIGAKHKRHRKELDIVSLCTITPQSAADGQSVEITCEFSLSSEYFAVHLYKRVHGEPGDLEILTFAKLPNKSAPSYHYYEDGYRVIGDVDTHMTVAIDSVTVEQAGSYSCKPSNVIGDHVQHCDLEVKAKEHITSCDVLPMPVGQPASVECHFNIDLLRGHRKFRLERQSRHGVYLGRCVECIRQKGNSQFCQMPNNDCVGQADRQKSITCQYDHKQYCVDISTVTPSTFTVIVLNVSTQSEGFYVCKPVPAIHGDFRRCQLSISGDEQTTNSAAEDGDKHDGDEQTTNSAADDGDKHNDYVPALVVCLLIFITVLVFICLLYKNRRRVSKCRRRGSTNHGSVHSGDEDIPLETLSGST